MDRNALFVLLRRTLTTVRQFWTRKRIVSAGAAVPAPRGGRSPEGRNRARAAWSYEMGRSEKRTDMASYIEHPDDIPIEFRLEDLMDASCAGAAYGGLAFRSDAPLQSGQTIRIRIALAGPVFEAPARVSWLLPSEDCFVVGIDFLDQEDYFRARMVEQLCHIEHYKRSVREHEGRILSGEEAAMEWIRRFAGQFPNCVPAVGGDERVDRSVND
jgi:hypothetical protein